MICYETKEEMEFDDKILGSTSNRSDRSLIYGQSGKEYFIYKSFGDFDGLKNVTRIGIYSRTHGIIVPPTTWLEIQDNFPAVMVGDMCRLKIKKFVDTPGYVWGAYKCIDNITCGDIKIAIDKIIEENSTLKPITGEELYNIIEELRRESELEKPKRSR